jgi:hypothetical protein
LQAKAQELFVYSANRGALKRAVQADPLGFYEGNFSRFGKERGFSLVLVLVVVLVLERLSYA